MGLYGLDFMIDKEDNIFLSEINGVNSGMDGFNRVYGDDRVKKEVYSMLKKKYGNIAINDGSYARKEFMRSHPVRFGLGCLVFRSSLRKLALPEVLRSKKAETGWMHEDMPEKKIQDDSAYSLFDEFEIYEGQESAVFNLVNHPLANTSVNSFVSEEITRNKLLQYILLKDSEISGRIIDSCPVGLGISSRENIIQLLSFSEEFILKPILGTSGIGVEFISKKEAEKYLDDQGAVREPGLIDILSLFDSRFSGPEHIEDLIDKGDYCFEHGISLLQPFIDSSEDGIYSCIRAIVCEGKFIDAYKRVSRSRRVNLSQDADAVPFERRGFPQLCEKVAAEYEKRCSAYSMQDFKPALYNRYLDERGRTTDSERELRILANLSGFLASCTNKK